jgi:hypothetical protein
MWKDDIVEEVRSVRSQIGAEYGHDLRRIVENLRRMQIASGRRVVTLKPRAPRQTVRASGSAAK